MSAPVAEWPMRALGTITTKIGSGATPRGGETAYLSEGVPFIRSMNVHFEGIRWDGLAYLGSDDARQLEGVTVRTRDVLLNITGASIGRVTVVPPALDGARVNQHVCILRPDESLDPDFLAAYFRSPAQQQAIASEESGATRQALTKAKLQQWQVPCPPLHVQREVVAHLDACFARTRRARAALDEVPALLDSLRQSILAAAFRGDLTADWRAKNPDVEPASELLKRIRVERRRRWEEAELAKMLAKRKPPKDERWKAKYEEPEPVDEEGLPELPDGWCWASVELISDLQLGQQRAPVHADAEQKLPYVRAANITWNGLDLSDVKEMGFPNPERYLLRAGDVLLSEASGSASEVGKPAIWRGEIEPCCYQKTLLRARPTSGLVSSEWLYLSFLADARLGRFASMAPGVGILHLTADRMLRWPVPVAPVAEQAEAYRRADAALRTASTIATSWSDAAAAIEVLQSAILAGAFEANEVDGGFA